MSTIEDRLHSAIRETAGEITPGSVPPLTLPGPARPGWLGRAETMSRARRGYSWRRTAAPLAAAAAVVAVIAGSIALTSSGHLRSGPPGPAGGGTPGPAEALAAALAGIPAYYVGLPGYQGQKHRSAVVRASATGAALATVRVPPGYRTFTWVSGAADDRTFVVSAQRQITPAAGTQGAAKGPAGQESEAFFLLRFSPATHTARLRLLPVPPVRGNDKNGSRSGLGGIALSPDGSKLAMIIDRPSPLAPEIRVAEVATGSQRTWQWHGPGWLNDFWETLYPLSWEADGRTLAFQQGNGFYTTGVRLLDTQAPGSDLRSSSRLAAQWQFTEDVAGNIAITPDGSKVVAPVTVVTRNPVRSSLRITEFSARTGQVLRVAGEWIYKGTAGGQDVLWSNQSGSKLIVLAPAIRPFSGRVLTDPAWAVGVLSGGHFTPLPNVAALSTEYLAW
jgi:hypothetical protein